MQTDREQAPAPPKGFRKAISVLVKLQVVLGQSAICKDCGGPLGALKDIQFDHDPAIQLRGWDGASKDTVPPCNDQSFITARHTDCHASKTSGRRGESDKNRIHGDVSEIAKLRRLTLKEAEYRRQLLTKADPESEIDEGKSKPRSRWGKRPFNRSGKRGSSTTRAEERDAGAGQNSLH